MAYPKALSEKSIKKMCEQFGLTDEKVGFLGNLFEGAAFLYGIILIEDLWNVYKELSEKTKTVKLLKKDLLAFSSIARRENHDYYIYEIDELYPAEKRSDQKRFLILKEIMKAEDPEVFYDLFEKQVGRPYYVPENLTEISGHIVTEQEKKLVKFIENLKATSPVIHLKYNREKTKPSPHQGKKLKDFTYISSLEALKVKWLSGKCAGSPKKSQEKKLREYLESIEGSFAERIFRNFRFRLFTGRNQLLQEIKILTESLDDIGVELTMDEAKQLISLLQDFNNNSHLYANRGWTPAELSAIERAMNPGQQQILSFGPGIMQAAKEGKISLEELKKKAESMGFKVEMDN